MKTLFLVRHAKSSWDYPQLDDIDRPLNKRGKKDAPKMAARMAVKNIFPDLVISSPAKRALKTCHIFADEIRYPKGEIEVSRDVYHASEDMLLRVVKSCDDLWKTVMIFGHNPGFTDFANSIANENIGNIPTCGIFGFTIDVETWAEVDFGKGKKILFDYPKNDFDAEKG